MGMMFLNRNPITSFTKVKQFERKTRYAAELYNVDVRQDQRYLASRFSPDFEIPLSILGMEVAGDPNLPREISCVQALTSASKGFEGPEKTVSQTS